MSTQVALYALKTSKEAAVSTSLAVVAFDVLGDAWLIGGLDTLTTVERLQFADGLYGIDGIPLPINGTDGANDLVGTGGADTISGLGGDDTITGGAGNDSISGGEGRDTAVFSGAMAA